MAIKERCVRCLKVLREDGTCQNEKCPRYAAPKEAEAPKQHMNAESIYALLKE